MATSAKELLEKYKLGTCSAQEKLLVEDWFMKYGTDENIIVSLQDVERIKKEMWQVVQANRNRSRKLWHRIAAIAAAVALIVLGIYFFNVPRHPDVGQDPALAMNDIAPGKNGATITFANGKVIQLSDAKSGVVIGDDKLAYNDGSSVTRHPEFSSGSRTREATMTAQTAKGQTYIFTLPDGTKVWLNAASSLTIPSGFSGTESRIVELSGEAYFEVATSYTSLRGRRTKQSFIVKTAGNNGRPGQEVTVLGTHFNINSYSDEGSVKTTLLEGSVRVSKTTPPTAPLLAKEGTIILKPNQQSVLTDNNRIQVKEIDPTEAIAWQKGNFLFEHENIKTVMRKLARWYDIEVVYEGNTENIIVGGTVSRFSNVSKVLGMLQETGAVKFRIEGKKIYVNR